MSNYRPEYDRDGRRNYNSFATDRYPPPRSYDNNAPYSASGYGRPQYGNDHYAPPPPPAPRGGDYYSSFNAPRDPGLPPRPPPTSGLPRGLEPRDPPSNRYETRPSFKNNYNNNGGGGGFSFQGAGGGGQGPNFTFRAQGQPAPHFPPTTAGTFNNNGSRPQRRFDNNRGGQRGGGQRGGGFRGRGRGFKSFKAADRKILYDTNRETTPEQLEDMNMNTQPRFKDNIDVVSDEDAKAEDGDGPRKRTKFTRDDGDQVPKWSNPDPYTVLPPPETLGAPKKDIVEVIRKAKVDSTDQTSVGNAVTQNDDFISFNDNAMKDEEDSEEEDDADDPFKAPMPSFDSYEPTGSTSGPMGERNVMRPMQSEYSMRRDYDSDDDFGRGSGAGSKRKRGKETQARFAKDIVDEWKSDGSNPTPWCKTHQSQNTNSAQRLHDEMKEFFDYVTPFPHEQAIRENLIMRIQNAVQSWSQSHGRGVEVHCFGSFAAGLYLPTADMDLVAISRDYKNGMRESFCVGVGKKHSLASHLKTCGIALNMVVIGRAKVPLLKFKDSLTGIKVDLSFENDTGLITQETFAQWKQQFPEMPVIVVLIKQLLAMRGRDEVFTGGLGGFSVICLVVSMLQLMPEVQSNSMRMDHHLGQLLMNFLDLYGNRIDIRETGIIMEPPGYFSKTRKPHRRQNLDTLTIIDPNKADNDISGGSREVSAVLDIFKAAYAALQRRLDEVARGEDVGGSILAYMWGGNYDNFEIPRAKLERISRDLATGIPAGTLQAANPMQQSEPSGKVQSQGGVGGKKKKKLKKGSNAPDSNSRQKQPKMSMGGKKDVSASEPENLIGKGRFKAKLKIRKELREKAAREGHDWGKGRIHKMADEELKRRHGPGI